ncbi:hypothetical protein Y032_0075g964 [Ancylostoma ceylanicum]|uniref:Uncharacterized protein n=1 Tax=Ancylostoma ceylanicum TaxID=53326 RepID=A0A016TV11_9BILA|nr:hypothetical protein Y032_0075g964 [Ancylostoma ceylanicum]
MTLKTVFYGAGEAIWRTPQMRGTDTSEEKKKEKRTTVTTITFPVGEFLLYFYTKQPNRPAVRPRCS